MATTPSDLSGLFKEAYGDDIINLIPDSAKNTKIIPFVSREKETGNFYHQPVIVANEHGITYAAPDSGAFALEDAVAMQVKDAQVQGSQMLLRSSLSYDAAAKAARGRNAFMDSTQLLVENMLESLTKRLEITILHGRVGIGEVAIGDFVETAPGATTAVVEITDASFADGIWAGAENAKLVFYSDSDDTIGAGTNLDANADTNQVLSVVSVDVDSRKITVSGSAAAIEDINDVSVTKALRIYFKGAVVGSGATFAYAEGAGLKKIITNTGTLFNINAATYNLWRGNISEVTGQLTFGKILTELSKPVARGGLDEKVVVEVNPRTWANLASDLAALRMFDDSYKKDKGEIGVESLLYIGQNGEIEVISYNLVKRGEAFVFPPKRCKRVGAQEISFQTPGSKDGEIFLHLPNNAGFEMRAYTDQCVFVETPAKCLYIDGFTNS